MKNSIYLKIPTEENENEDGNSAWLHGLESYTIYSFRVRSVSSVGSSEWALSEGERTSFLRTRPVNQSEQMYTAHTFTKQAVSRKAAQCNSPAYINGVGYGGLAGECGQVQ